MLHEIASRWIRGLSGPPSYQIWGRASYERDWHVLSVYVTPRRNLSSRLPLWAGTCITWTANVIAVGQDFSDEFLDEQKHNPSTRDRPLGVTGGRLSVWSSRTTLPTASEIMAHECGHTGQARRMGGLYWPIGACLTRCGEGRRWWNRFENEASATGLLGGLV